ncbi:acetyl-CoA synthetase-like protein [Hymenopellis radicata]|nr:acetyl-CoA synthetase-like protein [Hymenopellis radicata]
MISPPDTTPMTFLTTPPNLNLHTAEGWTIPPLDGSLSVPELYDFHYKHNADHPVFVYAKADSDELTYIRYSDLVPAAHRAGWYVTKTTNFNHSADMNVRPIVAVLAATDTITFFTMFVGMFRGGIPFFPISPRNSPAAIAHLLKTTRPSHLFISSDTPMQELMAESMALLEENDKPIVAAMPVYEDIYTGEREFQELPPKPRDLSATRIVAHSSGSTSFPKPIHWNDRTCGQASNAPWFGARSYTGKVFAVHCLAMYHAIGINFMNWISTTGLVMAVFPPVSPAVIPSFDAVYHGLLSSKADFVFTPPVFIEIWAKDPEKVQYLKNLKEGICFGGGPMNKATGDLLAKEGCSLYSIFGITEAGVLCNHTPEPPGMNWEYLQMNRALATAFSPQGDGTYELIVISKPYTEIHVVNTQWEGEDAYASNDLFLPHPTLQGHWKLIGRKDDQLMLSTGEKTNPTPLEAILSHDPYVTASVMFGRGKFQNGILVQLKPEFAFDPQDEESVVNIEKMNDFAPSHSRLFKEMVIFANLSKPFSFNSKGAPRRAVVLSEYDREIEALYKTVEERVEVESPSNWTFEASLSFARAVVNNNLHHPAKDDEDIFQCGCDSLQAAWIRNALVHALREGQPAKARLIGSDFVYDNPRINAIAAYICESVNSEAKSSAGDPVEVMHNVLGRLATPDSFSKTAASKSQNVFTALVSTLAVVFYNLFSLFLGPSDVVLVTGTTGSLGSATLARLVQSSAVKKVYAFNRPSKGSPGLLDRQRQALESKGYDPAIASSPKVVLVEAEITENGLGVDAALDREIRRSVTHIIHIAWRVDFNLRLSSYESILKGMRTLIDLALTSPQKHTPRFVFTSSVGVLRNIPAGMPVPETPLDDPKVAVGQGYSESKWVGEQMLYQAAKQTALRPIVVRTGQIAGGVNGGWNTSDWVPAIIKSSVTLRALPEFEGTCTWIPLDIASGAVIDFSRANTSKAIFTIIGQELNLPLVPYAEWVRRLEGCSASVQDVPALKLLDFFKAGLDVQLQGREAIGIPALSCEGAIRCSTQLQQSRPIQPSEVVSWLDYWAQIGFIPSKRSN